MKIERSLPLAVQVANLLRERLREEYPDMGRLPGEIELAAELGVSRATVRQGLAILEQEGAVLRLQGNGTYANPQVLRITARAETAYEFTDLIRNSGHEAEIAFLRADREEASEDIAMRLEIQPGSPLLVVHKVFLADGQPAVYCIDTVPVALLCEPFEEAELEEPIFNLLERRCHVQVMHILAEIIPLVAEGELVDLIGSQPGEPLLHFSETYYSKDNHPVMFSLIYYKDPLIRFTILRKKI